MPEASVKAISISQSLSASLNAASFCGKVAAVFERACNFVDEHGRMIALTSAELGNGPFSILVPSDGELFSHVKVGQLVQATSTSLQVGGLDIKLSGAARWESYLAPLSTEFEVRDEVAVRLRPYAAGLHLPEDILGSTMRQAAVSLQQALGASLPSAKAVTSAATPLVGLGAGLTPAGDDYLMGVMAGLTLYGRSNDVAAIAQAVGSQTTKLSQAFLTAATQSQFSEPWHLLRDALIRYNTPLLDQALAWIVQFGATSGQDALMGLAQTLLEARKCLKLKREDFK